MDIDEYVRLRAKTKSHQSLVRKAAEEYLKHPNYCLWCKKVIPLDVKIRPADIKRKKFCSQSCSATFSNQKRSLKKTTCPICGKKKCYTSKMCQSCTTEKYWNSIKNKPIKNFFCKGASRAKYNSIRAWARRIMSRSSIEKKCILCGYSEVVQVAHRKKLSSFPDNTPIGVVNAFSNMAYLCPNEHILYDRGKINF